MSFVQRLTKIQRKGSEGSQSYHVLQNQLQKINLKNGRKFTDFEKHHSDLKTMLQYLECQKSTRLTSTPSKNKKEETKKQSVDVIKVANIDAKQNSTNKIVFKDSPEKRLKLKSNKVQDEPDIFEPNRDSFLLRNLQCGKKISKENPENANELIKKSLIFESKSTQKQKRGIPNIGNTCYINAVLQCLFHMKDFNEGFVASYSDKNQILNKYLDLFDGVMGRNCQKVSLSTLPLKKCISKMCSLFIDFHQQDAHQFLKQLLQTIHQEINRVRNPPPYKFLEYSLNKSNLSILSEEYWNYYKKYDNSYIYDSLCGQVCNFVTCSNCKFQSVNFDNFLDLSLAMVRGKNKLDELLKEYFGEEVLGDYYYCSKCQKSSKKSLKRTEIWRNPNYLIIQLKRSQFGKKNSQRIKIPVRCLNLKPYFTSVQKQSRPTMYHLQGVVLHRGMMEGGHYWVHVKDGLNWYSIDDEKVSQLDRDAFVRQYENEGSEEAYILFYKCM